MTPREARTVFRDKNLPRVHKQNAPMSSRRGPMRRWEEQEASSNTEQVVESQEQPVASTKNSLCDEERGNGKVREMKNRLRVFVSLAESTKQSSRGATVSQGQNARIDSMKCQRTRVRAPQMRLPPACEQCVLSKGKRYKRGVSRVERVFIQSTALLVRTG